jgi:hypothetical protein
MYHGHYRPEQQDCVPSMHNAGLTNPLDDAQPDSEKRNRRESA